MRDVAVRSRRGVSGCTTASCRTPRSRRRRVALHGELSLAGCRAPPSQGLEVVFRPDPSVHDGRFANNAWLQELPEVADEADVGQRGADLSGTADRLQPDQR